MSKYLPPNHPSYGCDQAWFLFAVKNARGPGFGRILLVEAKSKAAVGFLERIVHSDGMVSPTCELLTVHRQCPTIGIRSDLAEEVSLEDFALDVVERARVDRDPQALEALYEAMGVRPEKAGAPKAKAPPPPSAARGNQNYEKALSALTGLGFSKTVAAGMLKPFEGRAGSMDVSDLVRESLRSAA